MGKRRVRETCANEVGEKRRGRPPLPEHQKSGRTSVTLPPDLHDAACRLASREERSVSAVLREALRELVARERDLGIS